MSPGMRDLYQLTPVGQAPLFSTVSDCYNYAQNYIGAKNGFLKSQFTSDEERKDEVIRISHPTSPPNMGACLRCSCGGADDD